MDFMLICLESKVNGILKKVSRSMKKSIVLKRATQDIFKVMPFMAMVLILTRILNSILVIWQVASLAKLIDLATVYIKSGGDGKNILTAATHLIICYALINIIPLIEYKIDRIDSVPKYEVWHNIMSSHMAEMSLEETLKPEIFDRYWRAKQALWQSYISTAFFSLFKIIPILIQLIGVAAVLASYNILLIIVAVLSVIPASLVLFVFNKKIYEFNHKQAEVRRRADYLWRLMTKKEVIRESRIFSFGNYMAEKYMTIHKDDYTATAELGYRKERIVLAADIVKYVMYSMAIILTIFLISSGKVGAGAFAACLTAFTTMQSSVSQLLNYTADLSTYCSYAGDYYDFMESKIDRQGSVELSKNLQKVKLDSVSYSYPESEKEAVSNVSIDLDDKGLYVVVGENGSGKTTLSRLLLALYEREKGQIKFNDESLEDLNKRSLWNDCSVMTQDFGKYAVNFYDNIGLSDTARLKAHNEMDRLINKLDLTTVMNNIGGGNTTLGIDFGGKELSGGEWQKLSMARTMFKNCNLYVFDEPTSAIDPIIENKLLSEIVDLSNNNICFVISHRMGICRMAKKIFVLKNGRLVQTGIHSQLVQEEGTYKNMWNAQADWYKG